MATLATIRTQVRSRIDETDPGNSHFSGASALDTHINEAVRYLGSLIEYPRSVYEITANTNDKDYSIASITNRVITIIDVYFGAPGTAGDIYPLKFLRAESIKVLNPSWLETSNENAGRPRQCFLQDRDTLVVDPRPDSSQNGKTIYIYYSHAPAALSDTTDVPNLPFAYHDIVQFYAAHLAYIDLKNVEMQEAMLKLFDKKRKELEAQVTRESDQNLGWQFTDFTDELPSYPTIELK